MDMLRNGLVLTVTPNPALDLGGTVQDIKPNEKSHVENETRSPGGNAINAARILTRLGIPVRASGFLGGGTGQEIQSLLEQEGLDCDFVPIQGSSRIGVTVSNRQDHRQTRLSFPGPVIQRNEKENLFRKIRMAKNLRLLILGGSLPKGFEISAVKKVLQGAAAEKIPAFVDCPAPVLKELISSKPFLIKPNLVEFQELIGSRVKSRRAILEEAHALTDWVSYVCVSSVEGGALLVTRDHAYFGTIPRVKIRSTVGAGDSMVGAMASRFYRGETSGADYLRWGLAAAAATLSHQGTELGRAREIRALHARTRVELIRTF